MYHIDVLAAHGSPIAEWLFRCCAERGLFPRIRQYHEQEDFFADVREGDPANAVIALRGVAGLNAAEHLRSLYPACRILWCSDLDFSLHAFRLRVDHFLLEPVTEEAFRQGLSVWFEKTPPAGI